VNEPLPAKCRPHRGVADLRTTGSITVGQRSDAGSARPKASRGDNRVRNSARHSLNAGRIISGSWRGRTLVRLILPTPESLQLTMRARVLASSIFELIADW
jgi:hypothetical protein